LRTLQQIVEDHTPIIDCVVWKDARGAAAAMKAHIETTSLLLIRQDPAAP
jgi:DNA-binding GntR family transcriptional regulator